MRQCQWRLFLRNQPLFDFCPPPHPTVSLFQGPAGTKGDKGERVSLFHFSHCLSRLKLAGPLCCGNTHSLFTPLFWSKLHYALAWPLPRLPPTPAHRLMSCPHPQAYLKQNQITSVFVAQRHSPWLFADMAAGLSLPGACEARFYADSNQTWIPATLHFVSCWGHLLLALGNYCFETQH